MKFILNRKVFENVQKSDKILKDNNIPKGKFIIKLEDTLKNNGLSSYMSYIVEIILDDYKDYISNDVQEVGQFFNDKTVDEIINGLKFIKSKKIDISKLNCFDISDFLLKISNLKDDEIRNGFINKYSPASIRSDVKNIIKDHKGFLFSNRYLTRIKNLTNQNIELLKKGSRFKTGEEWLEYVEKTLQDDSFSISELKNSNIKIFFENSEWIIYTPLDFKSYLIPNYKYWCTMTPSMFDIYKKFGIIIYLNKENKENSFISCKEPSGIKVYNYKNSVLSKEKYTDIIQRGIRFHT